MDFLAQCKANVICLQEVTLPFWETMINSTFFRDNFVVTDFPDHLKRTSSPYGVLVAAHKSIIASGSNAWEQDLPSDMGRRIVGMDIASPNGGPSVRPCDHPFKERKLTGQTAPHRYLSL